MNSRQAGAPLSANVKALGVVSLLADVASEMIYPLLPLFLTTVLGASGTMIGTIEGFADSTSSMLKLASGWWADRVTHKKPLVVLGYAISAIARPFVGLAVAPWQVMAVRMSDRTGKGIRTSPRDAMLADSSSPEQRGRAYGFHRALDNLGAVLGPLLAWALYEAMRVPMRSVFLWSAAPGILAIIVLLAFVKEPPHSHAPKPAQQSAEPLGAAFWRYLGVLLVFSLGASSDAFVLIRAQQLGIPVAMVPLLYAAFNLVKAASSTPGGSLSDRLGRRPLIIAGWALYSLVYVGFALASTAWHAAALMLVYGLFFGLTEGTEKALVADLVPAARRGTAFGWFNFTIGIAALPASVIFGVVWDRAGVGAAFAMGAALAGAAAIGLLLVVPAHRRPA